MIASLRAYPSISTIAPLHAVSALTPQQPLRNADGFVDFAARTSRYVPTLLHSICNTRRVHCVTRRGDLACESGSCTCMVALVGSGFSIWRTTAMGEHRCVKIIFAFAFKNNCIILNSG